MIRKALGIMSAASLALMAFSGIASGAEDNDQSQPSSGKYSSVAIRWSQPEVLSTLINKTVIGAPANIKNEEQLQSQNGISIALDSLRAGISESLEPLLKSRGVRIVSPLDQNSDPEAIIFVVAESGLSDCALLGCQHGVKLKVSLMDNARKTTIWTGTFKVSASWPNDSDSQMAQKFYRRLVERFLGKLLN